MKRSMVFEGVVVTLLLLLSFAMLAMLMGGSPGPRTSAIGDITYTYVGNDNTLYAFSGDSIYAIDDKGSQRWAFNVPDGWKLCTKWQILMDRERKYITSVEGTDDPIIASDNGTFYAYLKPAGSTLDEQFGGYMDGRLIAISGDGKLAWNVSMKSRSALVNGPADQVYRQYSDLRLHAIVGRVYVFHDYNETVLDKNGTALWNVADVSDPASIDEDGYVYFVRSPRSDTETSMSFRPYFNDFRMPTAIVDACYPNGTLYWEALPGDILSRQSLADESLPLYYGGMIYAPMNNGVAAIYPNGTVKWTKLLDKNDFQFDSDAPDAVPGRYLGVEYDGDFGLYGLMPFDTHGNVYLQFLSRQMIPDQQWALPIEKQLYLIVIGPDGSLISQRRIAEDAYGEAKEGIGYDTRMSQGISNSGSHEITHPSSLSDMGAETLIAGDVASGRQLWEHTFNPTNATTVTLDESNAPAFLGDNLARSAANYTRTRNPADLLYGGKAEIWSGKFMGVSTGNDGIIYVNYQAYGFEYPVVIGQSKYVYAGGIYALDRNGSVLWYQPTGPAANQMTVTGNGTVFYRQGNGRLVVTRAGAAAGFTISALLYIFIRFACVGAVARAKARLNKNKNRSLVLGFIVGNPGSTLYDISRGSGINLGTVRYHAFILGLNHKIVASRIDDKFVRYFTNSGTYDREDQLILSLMRRDTMGKVMSLILRKPGISNVEIARDLDIRESVASRCIKELTDKGVIARGQAEVRNTYYIADDYARRVAAAMRRIQGE